MRDHHEQRQHDQGQHDQGQHEQGQYDQGQHDGGRYDHGLGAVPWWRDAVIYQIYIRSFADGNDDGIGDIAGIRDRLPYLRALGVDAVWVTPWYPSPMADGGYDVADYTGIDPRFGTLADAQDLIEDAHHSGLRVIIDLVPNHSSDRHPWFQEALRSAPGSAARARYHFRPGRGRSGELPPNNWGSVFGGPAWSRVTETDGTPGEWYLHLYAPQQPDLNWDNPQIHREFEHILRCWLDRGVDGFRVDAGMGMVKAAWLPDLLPPGQARPAGYLRPPFTAGGPVWGRPEVHDIYRRWRQILDSYYPERMLVGEVLTDSVADRARYVRPDELHQVYNFALLRGPARDTWSAKVFRQAIEESLDLDGAWPTWAISSHDVPRPASRYADPNDPSIGLERACALLWLELALPGATYIYQGEELGLPEADVPPEARQDPIWERSGHTRKGRDGCRIPHPWKGTKPPYGFTTAATSWLPMPAEWGPLTAAAQHTDPASTLTRYRQIIHYRRWLRTHLPTTITWLDTANPDVLAFDRGPLRCITNFSDHPCLLPSHLNLISRSDGHHNGRQRHLPPNTTAWLRLHA
jgi:alpha-glucosidase